MNIINSTAYVQFIFNKLLPAILILFVGWFLVEKISKIIKKAIIRSHIEQNLISFSNSVIKTLLRSIVILMAIACLGINISSIIAALGATLVTIGLALKDNLSNVASGIIIIINKPFKIGDFLETNAIKGKVKKIEMLYTTLVTPDNKIIIVPNSKLTADYVINYSINKIRRLDAVLPINKNSKFLDIKLIIDNIIKNNKKILLDPTPNVNITSFDENIVNVNIQIWCNNENYDYLKKNLLENIKIEFEKNNINF